MSRQNKPARGERKTDEQRKPGSPNAERATASDRVTRSGDGRNRADNTRIAGLDRHRLNDLYERSSL